MEPTVAGLGGVHVVVDDVSTSLEASCSPVRDELGKHFFCFGSEERLRVGIHSRNAVSTGQLQGCYREF